MDRNARFSPPAIGGSALLVIFAVLTLSVFAFLSLSTVQAEKRLADSAAQSVSDYYGADTQAEVIFAQLRSGELPPEVTISENIYSYQCPISENQQLIVELRCDSGNWAVLRWQAVAEPLPETSETMPVWDGSAP